MVLVMARLEAGPCERQPKTLRGELENNFRKPKDMHNGSLKKGQLTLSQGKMKKGDDVADDDNDDVVGTRVSQDPVTARLCC